MKVLSVAVVIGAFTSLAGQAVQRDADLAAIERFHQQEIAATLSRDPVALTDLWTDDAVRIAPAPPAEVGTQAIRQNNERWAAGSYVASPAGEPAHIRSTLLAVYKKLPDGSWKVFRSLGITE